MICLVCDSEEKLSVFSVKLCDTHSQILMERVIKIRDIHLRRKVLAKHTRKSYKILINIGNKLQKLRKATDESNKEEIETLEKLIISTHAHATSLYKQNEVLNQEYLRLLELFGQGIKNVIKII